MNQILGWLSGGDLRSDGMSNEVADFVLTNPELIDELFEGLEDQDDVVRAHTADALEKVARSRPDLIVGHLSTLIRLAGNDPVPMVRMHLAMIFGHLAIKEGQSDLILPALLKMLEDSSVFTKSWAITSLCIFARLYPTTHDEILHKIAPLQSDDSAAIRSRTAKALKLLSEEGAPFPPGWVKSEHLKKLAS